MLAQHDKMRSCKRKTPRRKSGAKQRRKSGAKQRRKSSKQRRKSTKQRSGGGSPNNRKRRERSPEKNIQNALVDETQEKRRILRGRRLNPHTRNNFPLLPRTPQEAAARKRYGDNLDIEQQQIRQQARGNDTHIVYNNIDYPHDDDGGSDMKGLFW